MNTDSLLRRNWRVPVVAVLGGVLAFLASFLISPTYQSSTRLIIHGQDANILSSSGQDSNSTTSITDSNTAKALADTYASIATSRSLAVKVVDDLHLDRAKDGSGFVHGIAKAAAWTYRCTRAVITSGFCASVNRREKAIADVQTGSTAQQTGTTAGSSAGQPGSYVLELSSSGDSPAQAQAITDTLADELVRASAQQVATSAATNITRLQVQLTAARKAVSVKTGAVTNYENRHNISATDQQAAVLAGSYADLQGSLRNTRNDLAAARARLSTVEAALSGTPSTTNSTQTIQTGRSGTSIQTDQANPAYTALVTQKHEAQQDISGDTATITNLQSQVASSSPTLLSARLAALANLQADLTSAQAQQTVVLNELQSARTNAAVAQPDLTRIDTAGRPDYPTAPKRYLYLFIGLLLGALAGAMMTWLAGRRAGPDGGAGGTADPSGDVDDDDLGVDNLGDLRELDGFGDGNEERTLEPALANGRGDELALLGVAPACNTTTSPAAMSPTSTPAPTHTAAAMLRRAEDNSADDAATVLTHDTSAADELAADELAADLLDGGHAGAAGGAVRRAVAVGAASQVGAKFVHLALNIVSTLAVVRYLAPGAYGVYAVVLSVTSLLGFVADFGLPKLAVREIAATLHVRADAQDAVVGTVIVLRLATSVLAIGAAELVLLVLHQPGPAYAAAAIASFTGVGEAVLASVVVVFQVRLAQQWEAFVRTAAELLETAAILLLVAHRAALAWLFVPPAVGTALAATAAYLVVRGRYGVQPRLERARMLPMLRLAAPIAPALLVGVVYRKLDVFTLAALRPSRDVGLYSSAAQPMEYVFLTTALLINVVFPLMSAAYGRGQSARFEILYRRGVESLVIITAVVPLVLLFVARPLAKAVFGAAYAGAGTPLVLLSLAVVPLTVTVWQALALLIGGLQTVTLRYNIATLAVAAVLCPALVSAFGMVGAGCAAVGTAAFVLVVSTRAARRCLHLHLQAQPFVRIAAAMALAAAALTAASTAGASWPLVATIGVLAFGVSVRVTGAHHSFTGVLA